MRATRTPRPVIRLFQLGVAALLLPIACGDEDEPSPQEKCEGLVNSFCGKAVDCLVEDGQIPAAQRNTARGGCVDEVNTGFSCEDAVAVEPSYDQCIDDIEGASCDRVLEALEADELPASCEEVILLGE